MGFLLNNCLFFLYSDTVHLIRPFSCDDKDLNDFFLHDVIKYEQQLLGKSYCFCLENDTSVVVCAFTLSNSSIGNRKLPGNSKRKLKKNIPHEKSLSSYPATLIGRLGVDKNFEKRGIGTELISFIKQWMLDPAYKTACRYLTVDAYNNDRVLKFYDDNGFKPLFSSEEDEKEYIGLSLEKELKTRHMYFDLMLI